MSVRTGTPRWDVIIVGAGPAGCATALALRRAGVHRVALLDTRAAPGALRPPRLAETAAPDLPGLLARLGLVAPVDWPVCLGHASAWGGPLRIDDFARRSLPPGRLLDRRRFDAWLRQAAQQAGAECLAPARLLAARWQPAGARWWVQVDLPDQTGPHASAVLHARLLVDASGRSASLARLLGHRRWRLDQQVALVADVPAAQGAQAVAHPLTAHSLVEAVPDGWWYACQHPDGHRQLALVTDQDLSGPLRRPAGWQASLARAPNLSAWLAGGELRRHAGPAVIVPVAAHSACLSSACGPGWLALGDALMSLDPLSACGVSNALRDALDATEQVLLPWLCGTAPAPAGRVWGQRAQQAWHTFLAQRLAMYAQVSDWRETPYWARRQGQARAAAVGRLPERPGAARDHTAPLSGPQWASSQLAP